MKTEAVQELITRFHGQRRDLDIQGMLATFRALRGAKASNPHNAELIALIGSAPHHIEAVERKLAVQQGDSHDHPASKPPLVGGDGHIPAS